MSLHTPHLCGEQEHGDALGAAHCRLEALDLRLPRLSTRHAAVYAAEVPAARLDSSLQGGQARGGGGPRRGTSTCLSASGQSMSQRQVTLAGSTALGPLSLIRQLVRRPYQQPHSSNTNTNTNSSRCLTPAGCPA